MADERKIGAKILCDELVDLGVEYVFGYPGGANLPIYDVINKTKINVVLNGDERCAGHAAEGYARATGKPGVALVTSGPGATNLVTPLADAKMDSTPLIGISGQVYSHLIGKDAFQETPIINVTQQITKHNYLVNQAKDVARVVREAFHIATTGRPGPVLIDITKDAQEGSFAVKDIDRKFRLPGYQLHQPPVVEENRLNEICDAIKKYKRPLLYIGQGIILGDAHKELLAFAEKAQIPVTSTVLGLGGFPASHALYQGMLGMHGAAYANFAIDEADLVICLGARFDDRVTGKVSEFIRNAFIIHIDVDAGELNKNKIAHLAVHAEVKDTLRRLVSRVPKADSEAWIKHLHELKRKYPNAYDKGDGSQVKPQYFLETLNEAVKGRRAVFATGVGQHQMWAAQYLKFEEPRTLITSAGLGTMGFGLPAAVGAALGRPDSIVFDIDGDGSFEMNLNEMRTLRDRNIPAKIIVLNNKILGMVGQWQRKFYAGNYSSVEFNDYPRYAEGIEALYGIKSARIAKPQDVSAGIDAMLKHDGPYFLEVMIPKEEDVYPMIPGGKTVRDIMLSPGQKLSGDEIKYSR
jgi:acetolactate synthase-1/2/3 large subunit